MIGPPLPPPRHATLAHALDAAAAAPSGITFVDLRERETTLRWEAVRERARSVAAGLVAAGVRPGERVALVLPTSPEFVAAFFGAWLARAVPVPLYPPARLGQLAAYNAATARLLEASGTALVLADPRVRAVLGEAIARARPRLGCRTPGGLPDAGGTPPASAPGPEDLALIQFSSGATREPKPVALTHRALVHQCAMLEAMLPRSGDGDERGVSWLPLYHDMGLIAGPLLAAYVPGSLVLIPPEHFLVRPALWLRAIARHRASLTPAPPFALGLCARRIADEELAGADLSCLRLLACGAEPIAADAVRRFTDRFAANGLDPAAVCPVYGLSEAALAATFCPVGRPLRVTHVDGERLARTGEVHDGRRPVVSVGVPIPGVEIEVRGEDGTVRPERRLGRVHLRSASLMSGYFARPADTEAVLRAGWLDTGDLGFVAGGELHLCGREKDLVIVRGANHDAHEFESCLGGVAGLRPGCAVAVGHTATADGSEALLILAERDPGGEARADEAVRADVRASVLAGTGVAPDEVVLLDPWALPRTSSGKLRRSEALRLHLAGELLPPPAASATRLAGALARSALGFLRAGTPKPGERSP